MNILNELTTCDSFKQRDLLQPGDSLVSQHKEAEKFGKTGSSNEVKYRQEADLAACNNTYWRRPMSGACHLPVDQSQRATK